jgi:carbamoyltransferase
VVTLAINEGINSSVVVTDGRRPVFALQEERIRRVKNFMGFPHEALAFTLERLGLSAADVDVVCLSNLASPSFTRETFYQWYDETADRPLRGSVEGERTRSFARRVRGMLSPGAGDAMTAALARHGLDGRPLRRTHHHANHAASAYYGLRDPGRDEPYLVLTLDGGGDGDCAHVYRAEGDRLELLASTTLGHSLGHLYARVTHLMGMTPHEHEYKLMGLAPYADPERVAPLLDRMRSYLDLDPRNPLEFRRGTAEPTYMQQPRLQYDFRRVRFDTLSGAIQSFTEELLCRWVQAAVRQTGISHVLAAGGVFMNVKANKLISELPEVEAFDVFPSCGDESLPFGAAWIAADDSSDPLAGRALTTYALGPDASFDLEEAREHYGGSVEFRRLEDPAATCAELLAAGEVVARCSGPMEFGARALGNRSILADPSNPQVVPIINRMIKHRDFWMPFAPAVLAERAADYVVLPRTLPSDDPAPFMMHTFDTTDRRDEIVAAVHQEDGTARAQTVAKSSSPGFHRVIEQFERRTGRAAVLNTSFNLHGFPIVTGACDAIDVLLRSSLENLVVDDQLVTKR